MSRWRARGKLLRARLLVPRRKFFTIVQMTGREILDSKLMVVQAENSHLGSKLGRKFGLHAPV